MGDYDTVASDVLRATGGFIGAFQVVAGEGDRREEENPNGLMVSAVIRPPREMPGQTAALSSGCEGGWWGFTGRKSVALM